MIQIEADVGVGLVCRSVTGIGPVIQLGAAAWTGWGLSGEA